MSLADSGFLARNAQVGPEPETIAPRAPASVPARRVSARAGRRARAATWRSLLEPPAIRALPRATGSPERRAASRAGAGSGSPVGSWVVGAQARRRSHSRYTAGVDKPPSARAKTQWKVAPVSSGVSRSPRPRPRAAPPTRLNGTSLPSSAQTARRSSRSALIPHRAAQPTTAAAQSALPPAMPPATGMSLAMWMWTSGDAP